MASARRLCRDFRAFPLLADVVELLRLVNVEAEFRRAVRHARAPTAEYLAAAFLDSAYCQALCRQAERDAPAHQPRHLELALARMKDPLDMGAVPHQDVRVDLKHAADGDLSLAQRPI